MIFPFDAGAWIFSGMAMQEYRMRQLKEEILQELERRQTVDYHWEGQDRDLGGGYPEDTFYADEMYSRQHSRDRNKK